MSHSSLFSFQWSSSLQDPRLSRQLLYSIKPNSPCQELTVSFSPFFLLRSLLNSLYPFALYATTHFALSNLFSKRKASSQLKRPAQLRLVFIE